MVIFHGKLLNNQMVIPMNSRSAVEIVVFAGVLKNFFPSSFLVRGFVRLLDGSCLDRPCVCKDLVVLRQVCAPGDAFAASVSQN